MWFKTIKDLQAENEELKQKLSEARKDALYWGEKYVKLNIEHYEFQNKLDAANKEIGELRQKLKDILEAQKEEALMQANNAEMIRIFHYGA